MAGSASETRLMRDGDVMTKERPTRRCSACGTSPDCWPDCAWPGTRDWPAKPGASQTRRATRIADAPARSNTDIGFRVESFGDDGSAIRNPRGLFTDFENSSFRVYFRR